MWGPDESANDLDRYFKILEEEARTLRECNPQSGTKPNFNRNRNEVGNSGGYNNRDQTRSNSYGNGGDNSYGGSSNSRPNNSYGNSSSNYGGGNQSSSNYGQRDSSGYGTNSSNNYGNNSNPYGGSGNNASNAANESYYGNQANNNSYAQTPISNNEDWAAPPPPNAPNMGNPPRNQTNSYNHDGPKYGYNEDQNQNQYGAQQNGNGGSQVAEDVDGYQRLDFNRCLISYNEPTTALNIRHVFLNIVNRNDLMDYTTKITECASQDSLVIAVQRDNQLAESFASQLRSRGHWAFEVTNQTQDPAKLLNQHSVYRIAVTTMSFLRDNVDLFEFPSLVINFDHVISHVKFLERFLHYRNAEQSIPQDVYIYEMSFNNSTTSLNLREYIQNQNKGN